MRLLVAIFFFCPISSSYHEEIFDDLDAQKMEEIRTILEDYDLSSKAISRRIISWVEGQKDRVEMSQIVVRYLHSLKKKEKREKNRLKHLMEGVFSALNRVEKVVGEMQNEENKRTELKRLFDEEFSRTEGQILQALYPNLRHFQADGVFEQNSKPIDQLADIFGQSIRLLFDSEDLSKKEKKLRLGRLIKVREYIRDFFVSLNWTAEWDSFTASTPLGTKDFHNLIVSLPTNSPSFLLFACHYDSKIIPAEIFIAATDSAVPCAMLMDLAASMKTILEKKQIGLKMVFFDGEEAFENWTDEDSLYGSRHLAEKWEKSEQLKKIDTMILLDLVGAKGLQIPNTINHGADESFHMLADIEEEILKNAWLGSGGTKILRKEERRGLIEDDHKPFLVRKVPIVHLISSPFPNVWHTSEDNEKALDYPTIEQFNAVLRVFISRFESVHLSIL